VLRDLYNQRRSYKGHLFVAFAGNADAASLVKDSTISPFNVSENILLDDFSPSQTETLTRRLSELGVSVDGAVFDHIYSWTSGHPHLTQRICEILERQVKKGLGAITKGDVDQAVRERMLKHPGTDSNVGHVRRKIEELKDPAKSLWEQV